MLISIKFEDRVNTNKYYFVSQMEIRINTTKFLIGIGIIVAILLVIIPFINSRKEQKKAELESSLVIEKIENVMKVVTVEGHYSEMINYQQADYDFPGFRKKALVQVNGRILMGYNLNQLATEADVKKKVLNIKNISEPQIIAIEADTKFFDLEQGIFNSFTKQELTMLDKKAKDIIRKKAVTDGLKQRTELQKTELIEALCWPLIADGWEIQLDGKPMVFEATKERKD